ncbi:MAG: HupE/UreJ family protein [Edaphobacter sp.]|uniref:HupE/UreJ family protein n=1 Tax=Edaphobacter sp. TaxID=1934404 RepID=UPI0023A4EDCA|nr:HupE/UreJ family protein [Edaphobacter sp.]MDE1178726.1 HupE/UreJ family protein [Edaphobacter sp.]
MKLAFVRRIAGWCVLALLAGIVVVKPGAGQQPVAQVVQAADQTRFAWSGPTLENHHLASISVFRLGMRHIAEGTDHLLFLLVLLLPAPLLSAAGRWSGQATVRRSLLRILRIVTAFTLGHSLTLALSAFGLVRLPSRPVEVLIAVSILVSAIHAMRPLFPGREAFIAGFFGLIHGMAFASAISELGVTGWYRGVSIAGFNLGIEAMQLMVVALTLPSLLLLSRTPLYAVFRLGGSLFAAVASIAWIAERGFRTSNVVDPLVEAVAHHAAWAALALLVFSLLAWLLESEGEGDGRQSVKVLSGS